MATFIMLNRLSYEGLKSPGSLADLSHEVFDRIRKSTGRGRDPRAGRQRHIRLCQAKNGVVYTIIDNREELGDR